jgi:hypothetical protein
MKVKEKFLRFGTFHLNNGAQIRLWEDKWIGNHVLKYQYPSLYNIVRRKSDTVAKVLSGVPLNVSFQRQLTGNNLVVGTLKTGYPRIQALSQDKEQSVCPRVAT